MTSAELARRFNLPNVLRLEDAPGGLVRAVVSSQAAEAEIYLQGAHVARWKPRRQRPVLFLSSKSLFTPGKAIRGGVPVIFPWFGPRAEGKPGPVHGFARITEWTLEGAKVRNDGDVEITLALAPNDSAPTFGYGEFALRFRVTVGSNLQMELEVHNYGKEPFVYEEAFHAYFAVGDVRQTSVSGLEGTFYIDKTDGFKRKQLGSEALRIAKETDQVHLYTNATCVIHDSAWNRRLIVEKSGSETTVIWNPWIDKTTRMSDMAPDEWQQMICVETANAADNALSLAPGGSHKLTASIRLESAGT
jgi:glucose-6-phosphate 1-epimerase